jgi:hypothetical protein
MKETVCCKMEKEESVGVGGKSRSWRG